MSITGFMRADARRKAIRERVPVAQGIPPDQSPQLGKVTKTL